MAYLFQRGNRYHLKYYIAGKQKEASLRTSSLQVAREKMRKFESALATGNDSTLPTHTDVAQIRASRGGPYCRALPISPGTMLLFAHSG